MKVLYTATVLSHICQFHLPYLKKLHEHGHIIHVAAHDNLAEKSNLTLSHADQFSEIPFSRSPFSKSNINAFKQLKKIIDQEKYDVIVCNTPVGGLLTRLAAYRQRKTGTRVIYIAHGFHFYKGAPIKNWLVYYPIEKLMARLCDVIVAVNQEDYSFAQKRLATSIAHIHGIGVSTERYHPASDLSKIEFRVQEGLKQSDFVILCTGELNKNKDQKTLLKAASLLKEKIPALKVLLAGNGPLEAELKSMVDALNLRDVVRFLGYRTDLERVVPAVDLVVSCSHREGLPLNIVEAMLCGKPVIAADNRGSRELVIHTKSGYLFKPGDFKTLSSFILQLKHYDEYNQMGEVGYNFAQKYSLNNVVDEVINIIDVQHQDCMEK